jgi:hypothetical protein
MTAPFPRESWLPRRGWPDVTILCAPRFDTTSARLDGVSRRWLLLFLGCGSSSEPTEWTIFGADTTPDPSGGGYTYNTADPADGGAGEHFSGCRDDCIERLSQSGDTFVSCEGPISVGSTFSDGIAATPGEGPQDIECETTGPGEVDDPADIRGCL